MVPGDRIDWTGDHHIRKGPYKKVAGSSLLGASHQQVREPPMTKIHDFGISAVTYYCREKNNLFPEIYGCPHKNCRYTGRLWRNGFYERNCIWFTEVYRIVIQRYRCPVCGRTVSLIPSFLTPHFQYCLGVIFVCLRIASKICLLKDSACSQILTLSHQHIRFYGRRLEKNAGLCTSVLTSLGYPGPIEGAFLPLWANEVECRGGIEQFALRFDALWHKSFLAAP